MAAWTTLVLGIFFPGVVFHHAHSDTGMYLISQLLPQIYRQKIMPFFLRSPQCYIYVSHCVVFCGCTVIVVVIVILLS